MFDFILVFTIILEIICCKILIDKIIEFEKKVNELNIKVLEFGKKILEINLIVKDVIKKINKIVSILTNRKFISILRIIQFTISVIQIVILMKSLDFSKGLKSINFKKLKKIFYTQLFKELFKKSVGLA